MSTWVKYMKTVSKSNPISVKLLQESKQLAVVSSWVLQNLTSEFLLPFEKEEKRPPCNWFSAQIPPCSGLAQTELTEMTLRSLFTYLFTVNKYICSLFPFKHTVSLELQPSAELSPWVYGAIHLLLCFSCKHFPDLSFFIALSCSELPVCSWAACNSDALPTAHLEAQPALPSLWVRNYPHEDKSRINIPFGAATSWRGKPTLILPVVLIITLYDSA